MLIALPHPHCHSDFTSLSVQCLTVVQMGEGSDRVSPVGEVTAVQVVGGREIHPGLFALGVWRRVMESETETETGSLTAAPALSISLFSLRIAVNPCFPTGLPPPHPKSART
jgi:hypothetical protein